MKNSRFLRHAFSLVVVCTIAAASPVAAHHILGVPHYAYDEDYPQTPVLTSVVTAGAYEVKMTGYPGEIVPGEPVSFHVYIKNTDSGRVFDGEATLTIRKKGLLSAGKVIYGPSTAELDERIYKFYPLFPEDASFLAELRFEDGHAQWVVDLPIVVGEAAAPWVPVGWSAAAATLLLFLLRAVAIKLRRRRRSIDEATGAATAKSRRGQKNPDPLAHRDGTVA